MWVPGEGQGRHSKVVGLQPQGKQGQVYFGTLPEAIPVD